MPDYDKLKFEVMPSDKPLTQAARPVFYADLLPKKDAKPVYERKSNSPPGFKF
jgi:hypothetical protein